MKEKMTQNGYPYPSHNLNQKNWVCFLSGFRNINKQLKHKPYPMPKINEMLLKLEGFRYDKSLDLNMVYYHIWHSEKLRNLCMFIIPWVKYSYKHLKWDVLTHQSFSNRKLMIHSKDFNLSIRTYMTFWY